MSIMKRLIFIFALSIISIHLCAQDLSFKGVMVDGDVTAFVKKLQAKGMTLHKGGFKDNDTMYDTHNDDVMDLKMLVEKHLPIPMEGIFLDQEVIVAIYFTRTSHKVYNLEVMFTHRAEQPEYRFWDSIQSALLFYTGLKNQLEQKYNAPFAVTEQGPQGPLDNTQNIKQLVSSKKVQYRSGYMAAPLGEVIAYISTTNNKPYLGDLCVILDYININNKDLNSKEINDIYQSEI